MSFRARCGCPRARPYATTKRPAPPRRSSSRAAAPGARRRRMRGGGPRGPRGAASLEPTRSPLAARASRRGRQFASRRARADAVEAHRRQAVGTAVDVDDVYAPGSTLRGPARRRRRRSRPRRAPRDRSRRRCPRRRMGRGRQAQMVTSCAPMGRGALAGGARSTQVDAAASRATPAAAGEPTRWATTRSRVRVRCGRTSLIVDTCASVTALPRASCTQGLHAAAARARPGDGGAHSA